jgi:response regulator NasT
MTDVDADSRTSVRRSDGRRDRGATRVAPRWTAEPPPRPHLRIQIANESPDRLEQLSDAVGRLGHEALVGQPGAGSTERTIAHERPDAALIGVGSSAPQALDLIEDIAHAASCPVIALLRCNDPEYIHEAAARGAFAYVVEATPAELQAAIDITLRRFHDIRQLEAAFTRRATIEQAKGILMARHGLTAASAFELLRTHSQRHGRKVIQVAEAIVASHLLLLTPTRPAAPASRPGPAAPSA